MKKILTSFALAVLFVAGSAASDSFAIKSISTSLRSTPVPQYNNVNSRAKTGGKNRWLRLQVTFIPSSEDKKISWYDDVTMEGCLVILRPEKPVSYVVLSGKTRFFTIPADDREHQGFFYVPPVILNRYCGDAAGALKAIRMFRVSFYGPGRVLLGEGFWAVSGRSSGELVTTRSKTYRTVAARMKEYEKPYRNVAFLQGGLYSKERTPWVYFDYDFHDLIYDNVQSQVGEDIRRTGVKKSE